ncbi:MAG TPA: hypothetical protein VH854_11670 [Thermoanaerobaculia bacterium]|jgi:hypothetical protein|nr:hypothetical protein [Thermoanaerobaculia bacterium]
MRQIRLGLAAVLLGAFAASASAGEVVVLKGGTVVPLKEHWVRKGNNAYMTRADGTLLMVPVSEIDREKTAAANRAAAAPPPPAPAPAASTPAEVARVTKDGPKAKVRITDADVSHPLDLEAAAAGDEKKDQATGGIAKVEVGDYTQEKNGEMLAIRGALRNTGQTVADGLRLHISAIDDKGQPIDGGEATLSKGTIPPGGSVDFNASLKIGDKVPASIRFAPQWAAPKPPPAAAQPGVPAAATGAPAAAQKPVPTPYGRGTLYAPPVANAPSQAPADGKTGYIPGATSPDNQPKPPNR